MLMLILIILFYYERHKIICSCSNFVSVRGNHNYQNFLAKDLKDQFKEMNMKQKVRIKIRQMSIDIFPNQTLLELINDLF